MTVAMIRIADLACALGVTRVDLLPGCWEWTDGEWSVSLNGHPDERDDIPPLHAAVSHRGFPMGIVGIGNGILIGGVERAFIAALEAAIVKAGGALTAGEVDDAR